MDEQAFSMLVTVLISEKEREREKGGIHAKKAGMTEKKTLACHSHHERAYRETCSKCLTFTVCKPLPIDCFCTQPQKRKGERETCARVCVCKGRFTALLLLVSKHYTQS